MSWFLGKKKTKKNTPILCLRDGIFFGDGGVEWRCFNGSGEGGWNHLLPSGRQWAGDLLQVKIFKKINSISGDCELRAIYWGLRELRLKPVDDQWAITAMLEWGTAHSLVGRGFREGLLWLHPFDYQRYAMCQHVPNPRSQGFSTTQPAAKVLRTLFILYLSWFAEPKLSPRLCLFPAHFVGANEQPAHLIELVFWHLLAN